jgi:major membrane immunogen (membrane-anchored lipoprotein)
MKKIIMVSMLILTVLFTGCGKEKEVEELFKDPTVEEVQSIEERIKEKNDYIKEIVNKQLEGLDYEIAINPGVVNVVINSEDETLKKEIEQQIEGEDFIKTRTNMAQWSGEVKGKVKNKYKESITVYYYYSVGDYLYINSHDGFVTTTYLDYCR